MPDRDGERGLYQKFNVSRVWDPVGKHADCRYFVLDLDHDRHARAAVATYARACAEGYPRLARDLMAVATAGLDPGERPPWVTVTLPLDRVDAEVTELADHAEARAIVAALASVDGSAVDPELREAWLSARALVAGWPA
jgi:hypothetical protein